MTTTDAEDVRTRRVRADAPDLLEALLTAAGPHLDPVLDVGTSAGGDLLLVLPRPAARLPDLLEVPGWPLAGEAVTVLVPLAQALARLHARGVALGSAGAESVVLDAAGSPSWSPAGAPVLLRRVGGAAFGAAVEEDRRRFAALASALVDRAGGRLGAEAGASPDELVDALFQVADPVPVRLAPRAAPTPAGPPSRLVAVASSQTPDAAASGALVRAVRAQLRGVRPRVWAVAGVTAAALLAAVVLLPAGEAPSAAAPAPTARASAPRSVPAATRVPAPVAPRDLDAGDALPRLLETRAACLTAGDAACLDRVVGAGSPLRTADRAALTAGTEPVLPGAGAVEVLSHGGGTVVAGIGDVVVVAVREQDGWRLRDVVAEPPD